MSGRTIAVYSLKGGVGKTTLAVNLAWTAVQAGQRTLLWDLDAQGGASYILGHDEHRGEADKTIRKFGAAVEQTRTCNVDGLHLIPADSSLRDLDVTFRDLDKKKRLARVADEVVARHDCLIIDSPPGLGPTSEQVLRAADLVVVPVIPSALSQRAFDMVADHVKKQKGINARLLPVFTMADRRRALHRDALAAAPQWPVIPMSSAVEAMAARREPLGSFAARRSRDMVALDALWSAVAKQADLT